MKNHTTINYTLKKAIAYILQYNGRAYHFFETMVDPHCVPDEEGFTLHWLVVALHSVRGSGLGYTVYSLYNLISMSTIFSKKP